MSIKSRIEKLETSKPDGPSRLDVIFWAMRRRSNPDLPEEPQPPFCQQSLEQLLAKVRGRHAES